MKTRQPPDPSIHTTEPRFADLSHAGQVALAAWAVLLKSELPQDGERIHVPPRRYGRAAGDIAVTVGLRSRKRHNNSRPNDRLRKRP